MLISSGIMKLNILFKDGRKENFTDWKTLEDYLKSLKDIPKIKPQILTLSIDLYRVQKPSPYILNMKAEDLLQIIPIIQNMKLQLILSGINILILNNVFSSKTIQYRMVF
jgi:hypothetical protein